MLPRMAVAKVAHAVLIVLLADFILPSVMSDGTQYASGFDESRFRELQRGASMGEVKRALGEPLLQKTFADGETVFYYTRQQDERDNYRLRNVVFDRSGRVVRRVAEFYID